MNETVSAKPLFEVVTTTAGAVSIRNNAVNEIMHNPVGPWAEANALYIDQSNLRSLLDGASREEFVLFDVGLGAAANALSALACANSLGVNLRPLRIVSFERDLELLRFALENARHFDHFRGYEEALATLLEKHEWSEGRIRWVLREGDFLECIEREIERPHLIFFDPYSPKVNQDMWTTACFEKIRRVCREPHEGGTSLFTYSQATRIRTALLKAGFQVGYGLPTGLKEATTQAATDRSLLRSPLGPEWFERWRKSHVRYPFDCRPEDEPAVDEFIRNFQSSLS